MQQEGCTATELEREKRRPTTPRLKIVSRLLKLSVKSNRAVCRCRDGTAAYWGYGAR